MPFRFTFAWLDGRDAVQLNQVQLKCPDRCGEVRQTDVARVARQVIQDLVRGEDGGNGIAQKSGETEAERRKQTDSLLVSVAPFLWRSDAQINKESGMVGCGVDRFRHLGKMLKEVPVLPTPHTLAEYLGVLDLVEEFGRHQDIVKLL
jgi:hypothetical protein